jgi:predicted SAM-dependent methyltransferase
MPNSNLETILAEYFAGPGPHRLELGAGPNGKPGWLATDLQEHKNDKGTHTIALDAAKPFTLPDGCFDFIYCEHMIEHIPFAGGQQMLKECRRILKPGGIIRIVTPSLGFLLRILSADRSRLEQNYLEWSLKTFVPDAPAVTNAFFLNNFVRAWGHVFIYDHETLRLAMIAAGFNNIKECPMGRSEHQVLSNLENESRLPPGFLDLESMIFEGTK